MTVTDSRLATLRTPPLAPSPAGSDPLSDHIDGGNHAALAAEGQDSPQAIPHLGPRPGSPAGIMTAPPASPRWMTSRRWPEGHQASHGQTAIDSPWMRAVADDIPGGHYAAEAHDTGAAGEQTADPPAMHRLTPQVSTLADPLLALAADVLDDLEHVRIANENRLRQLTRTETDKDGEERGFGLDHTHPDVARLAALVEMLSAAEHQAELNLRRLLRAHPLAAWVKAQKGIGEKQAARLLATVGDPYWNDLHQRPRLVSELWSYCGFGNAATQRLRKGQKANWNATARMRAYLVAVSCMKAGGPYRDVYDEARAKYADAVHDAECIRCGPKGNPAQPGTSLSDGHKHARALRAVAKTILRDMWREARDYRDGTT